MEGFFNGVIRRLVAWGTVRGEVLAALDGSKLPTTKRYAGRGCLTEEHTAIEKETKRKVTVVRHVFGWKVLVLMDVLTRLPLAMKVVPIQAYEGAWLLPLVEQAQVNLAGYGRITTVVIDRGYLDGEDLWALDQQGITFVVVAKAGMVIREDALALALLVDLPGQAMRRLTVPPFTPTCTRGRSWRQDCRVFHPYVAPFADTRGRIINESTKDVRARNRWSM